LAEMVQVKYIDSDLLPNTPKVWWYGYGSRFQQQVEAMVQMIFKRGLAAKARAAMVAVGALYRKTRI
jgi:hypothetical protein